MVFISYSRDDIELVEPLVVLLKTSGQDVFYDKESIAFGDKWKKVISTAIQNSNRFLLFWSKSTILSVYANQEIEIALTCDKLKIIPILLDKSPLPPIISDLSGTDELKSLFKNILFRKRINNYITKLTYLVTGGFLVFYLYSFLSKQFFSKGEYFFWDEEEVDDSIITSIFEYVTVGIIIFLTIYLWNKIVLSRKYKHIVKQFLS